MGVDIAGNLAKEELEKSAQIARGKLSARVDGFANSQPAAGDSDFISSLKNLRKSSAVA